MRYVILALTLLFFVLGSVRFLPAKAQTGDWTTYEDYDPLVMAGYSAGEWQSVADGNALGGQLTQTSTANATLTLYFQVTEPSGGYSIIYSKAPDGGDFQVQLDDTTYGPFSSYATSSAYNQETSHVDLPSGNYSLTITNLTGTFRLEAIRVYGGTLVSSFTELTVMFEDPIYHPSASERHWTPPLPPIQSIGELTAFEIRANVSALSIYGGFPNYAAEANLFIQQGIAQFSFGHNSYEGDRYRVTLNTSGTVSLFYNTALLQSAETTPITSGQWKRLYVAVVNDTIKVALDGVELFALHPATPFVPGAMEFETSDETSIFWVDEFRIWTPGTSQPDAAATIAPLSENPPVSTASETPTALNEIAYYRHFDFNFDGGGDSFGTTIDHDSGYSLIDPSTPMPNGGLPFMVKETNVHENKRYGRPEISPDGSKILYTMSLPQTYITNIYMINVDGTDNHQVTQFTQPGHGSWPAWSPDGTEIIYVSHVTGEPTWTVHRIDLNGNPTGTPIILTESLNGIAWSPDRQRIAYATPGVGNSNIHVLDLNTAVVTPVTNAPAWTQSYNGPAWSPDGSKLAVSMIKFTQTGVIPGSIHVMSLTGVLEPVLAQGIRHNLYANTSYSSPVWSPDGTQIAFVEGVGGGSDIYLVNATGGAIYPLTNYYEGDIFSLSWGVAQQTLCKVVATLPTPPNEAVDMKAIVGAGQLLTHAGPTFNAKRTGGFNPSQLFTPDFRYEVYDTANSLRQVWFSSTETESWILGWMKDEIGNEYEYVVDHENCTAPEPTEFTFLYDRQAAAEYAIAHAYQNDDFDPRRFDQRRVSTFLPTVPFADIHYTSNAGTDSAFFTSEVIWMGGMPMTLGTETNGTCLGSNNANADGWHYCPDEAERWATITWRDHVYVLGYYIDALPSGGVNLRLNVFYNADIANDPNQTPEPSGANNGIFIQAGGVKGTPVLNGTEIYFDGDSLRANNISIRVNRGIPNPLSYERFDEWARGLGANNGYLKDVQAGDYMFINSGKRKAGGGLEPGTTAHGFIVAGWGPILDCADAIGRRFGLADPTNRLYVASSDAPTADEDYYVPYVVDYSGHPNGRVQTPVPRPFYCSKYTGGGSNFNDPHGWYFFKLPNEAKIEVDALYMTPEWSWSPTTAR